MCLIPSISPAAALPALLLVALWPSVLFVPLLVVSAASLPSGPPSPVPVFARTKAAAHSPSSFFFFTSLSPSASLILFAAHRTLFPSPLWFPPLLRHGRILRGRGRCRMGADLHGARAGHDARPGLFRGWPAQVRRRHRSSHSLRCARVCLTSAPGAAGEACHCLSFLPRGANCVGDADKRERERESRRRKRRGRKKERKKKKKRRSVPTRIASRRQSRRGQRSRASTCIYYETNVALRESHTPGPCQTAHRPSRLCVKRGLTPFLSSQGPEHSVRSLAGLRRPLHPQRHVVPGGLLGRLWPQPARLYRQPCPARHAAPRALRPLRGPAPNPRNGLCHVPGLAPLHRHARPRDASAPQQIRPRC